MMRGGQRGETGSSRPSHTRAGASITFVQEVLTLISVYIFTILDECHTRVRLAGCVSRHLTQPSPAPAWPGQHKLET